MRHLRRPGFCGRCAGCWRLRRLCCDPGRKKACQGVRGLVHPGKAMLPGAAKSCKSACGLFAKQMTGGVSRCREGCSRPREGRDLASDDDGIGNSGVCVRSFGAWICWPLTQSDLIDNVACGAWRPFQKAGINGFAIYRGRTDSSLCPECLEPGSGTVENTCGVWDLDRLCRHGRWGDDLRSPGIKHLFRRGRFDFRKPRASCNHARPDDG